MIDLVSFRATILPIKISINNLLKKGLIKTPLSHLAALYLLYMHANQDLNHMVKTKNINRVFYPIYKNQLGIIIRGLKHANFIEQTDTRTYYKITEQGQKAAKMIIQDLKKYSNIPNIAEKKINSIIY